MILLVLLSFRIVIVILISSSRRWRNSSSAIFLTSFPFLKRIPRPLAARDADIRFGRLSGTVDDTAHEGDLQMLLHPRSAFSTRSTNPQDRFHSVRRSGRR